MLLQAVHVLWLVGEQGHTMPSFALMVHMS